MGEVTKKFYRNAKMLASLESFEFYEASYAGGTEYTSKNYLLKHERESDDAYKRRKAESVLVNVCAQVIDLYNAHLYRKAPMRDFGNLERVAGFDKFTEDADFYGNSYESTIKAIAERGSIYGIYGIIVDKPVSNARTVAEELAGDVRPYLALYEPECIWDWKFSRVNGGKPVLVYLLLEDGDTLREWTQEQVTTWSRVAGSGNDYEQVGAPIQNKLGMIPFVLHKNHASTEAFEAESDISDIAHIQKSIYQLDSQAREIINRTAFPMMEIPESSIPVGGKAVGSGAAADVVVGTGNALIRPGGDPLGHRYVEPTHSSLPLILEWRMTLLDDLYKVARTSHASAVRNSAMSGVALEIEFQQLNALLADRGDSMEKTELAILSLYGKWSNVDFDGAVKYPDNFGIRDLGNDINTVISAMTVIPSISFRNANAEMLARRILPEDTDADVFKRIEAELTGNAALTSNIDKAASDISDDAMMMDSV